MRRCIALILGLTFLAAPMGDGREKKPAPAGAALLGRLLYRLDPQSGTAGPHTKMTAVAFSPDSREIATCIRASTLDARFVDFWDSKTGKHLRKLDTRQFLLGDIAYSPDGKRIAVCGLFGKIEIWEARKFDKPLQLKGLHYFAQMAAFSGDGKLLAAVGGGTTPEDGAVWNVETGKLLAKNLALNDAAHWVRFLPGDRTVAAAGNQEIRLWDWESGRQRVLKLPGLASAISPDGRVVAVAAPDGVRIIEIETGDVLWRDLDRREVGAVPGALAFAPGGRIIAASAGNGTVHLIDWVSEKEIPSFEAAAAGPSHLVFSPDGTRLAGVEGGMALIWDVADTTRITLPKPDKVDPDERDGSFNVLDSTFGKQANEGVWNLVAEGDPIIPRLHKVLAPAPEATATNIARGILELDNANFTVRAKAQRELLKLGEAVLPYLERAAKNPRSVEQRRRVEAIRQQLEDLFPFTRLRDLRGIAVLEQIGTPAARAVLEALAEGDPDGLQTRQALAALRRMDARNSLRRGEIIEIKWQ